MHNASSTNDRKTIVDQIIPVLNNHHEEPIGMVIRRVGFQNEEFYCETHIHELRVLIPCRRVNRIDDPYGVYILADGSLWRSMQPAVPVSIIGQVVE